MTTGVVEVRFDGSGLWEEIGKPKIIEGKEYVPGEGEERLCIEKIKDSVRDTRLNLASGARAGCTSGVTVVADGTIILHNGEGVVAYQDDGEGSVGLLIVRKRVEEK